MSNVKNYTDEQLLARVKSLSTYKNIPADMWLLFVRSNEDANDVFDDKVYIWIGQEFQFVTSCTTNKGNKGTAVMEADRWNYDAYAYGLHRGKMEALRQVAKVPYRRDYTNDGRTNPTTRLMDDIIFMNIHGATYNKGSKHVATKIGGWSEGCLVLNNNPDYERMVKMAKDYARVSICLINEF